MDSERESDRLFSLRLSRVMEDIGVNSFVIDRRRETYLKMETMFNMQGLMRDNNVSLFIFGSQTEATTTMGMNSDTDGLFCDNDVNVVLHLRDCRCGNTLNILVLKNELTPPQHCYLQVLIDDWPISAAQEVHMDEVRDGEGRILLANTRVDIHDFIRTRFGEVFRHGPSMTFDNNFDSVQAFHCDQLPEECEFMFNRPRPGHWPRPDTLARAKKTGIFLVPQSYAENPATQTGCRSTAFMIPAKLISYPYSKWQWRFSTSLMERILMFDLNTVQLKVYTLTKIMRKSFLKPLFGDRFSTFHLKTAMMFTIENYPPDIWREDNIINCVCLHLTTLKRWLKLKICPHFTISGVNLFVGKLNNWELPLLSRCISDIINNKFQCLFHTDMDNINLRLLQYPLYDFIPGQQMYTQSQTSIKILQDLIQADIFYLHHCVDELTTDYSVDEIANHLFILHSISDSQTDLEQEVSKLLAPFLFSAIASQGASWCIGQRQPIKQDIINVYHLPRKYDLMPIGLKFVSILYCSEQYDKAAEELIYCEGLLGPELLQYCPHTRPNRFNHLISSPGFTDKLISCSTTELQKKYTMLCITFTRDEINCLPRHLIYEMYRINTYEDMFSRKNWMKNAVTDCIPFLYYLQHLTFRELNKPLRAQTALQNLHEYTNGPPQNHIDTAFNMLGHCYELQNKMDLAWICYCRSLKIYNKDNAAIWHVARILHQFYQLSRGTNL